ncbi:hypothetical protein PFICI_01575 [Pestalotiopsis fici W106-1]|uniref:Zn(2)-C6 fungal-type domain-containing protein n=1 Tax=Pestalotiopsis fici (strain W106-1 / CGMCC3.15140) TaxID=1229662 RepID=W3XQG4_PESFW|nr:uncharacterized protein PFICI_01575 [Pestalotiopsis fici W106-1]ETS87747.1 hypothetical protein PFICI_01575 [Pestalotiopsis fici W106-1]
MNDPSMTAASQQFDGDWTSNQVSRQTSGRNLRKSCDRCHQQKLRCVRSNTSLEPCTRCQRVGVECVYSARSSKQANKNKSRHQNGAQTEPVTPVMSHQHSNSGSYEPEDLQLGSFFPSALDTTNVWSLNDLGLATHTHRGPVFSSKSGIDESVIAPPDVCKSGSDSSSRFTSICQTLETLFKTVTNPVREVFNAFDSLVRAMALEWGRGRTPPRDAHTTFDKYIDSKQASMAAQCYMLCIRLFVSLSEKLLNNLLASPMPVQPATFGLNTPDSTQFSGGGGLGTLDMNFSLGNDNVMDNFGLDDLSVSPTDSYEQAVDSAVNVLRVGTRLIGRMEQMLGIPPDMAVGTLSSAEQPSLEHQRKKRSLPARLVATTWEYETSIGNKCAITYFKRYRAAILGLAHGHM